MTTATVRRRPSNAQLKALAIAAAGRAQYGSEYPARDRHAAARGRHTALKTFLVDDHDIYGSEHATWQSLEERGWITVRHDLLPTTTVPAKTVERTSITGEKTTYTIPEHPEPTDPGWRAVVEITPAGAELLARHTPPAAR